MTEPPPSLGDAARSGLRRAGFHLMKAGYEVLTGVGAFLEEIARTRPPAPGAGPHHIPVEPEPVQRIPLDDDDPTG